MITDQARGRSQTATDGGSLVIIAASGRGEDRMDVSDLIERLAMYQIEGGMTQAQLARRLRVMRCTLNYWFNGRHVPTAIHIYKIAKLLGVEEQVPELVIRNKRRMK